MNINTLGTRLLLVALLAVAAPLCKAADPPVLSGSETRQRLDEVRTRLQLTPQQIEKITPLMQERNAAIKALREQNNGDGPRRSRLAILHDAQQIQAKFFEQVGPLLSESQQAEWRKLHDEMRAEIIQRLRNRPN